MRKTKFTGVAINDDFNMEQFHAAMQKERRERKNTTLKSFLADTYGEEMSPEKFYSTLGLDLNGMTVEKMLSTDAMSRYLFPEVFRDAIIRGLQYAPFYPKLVTGEETINSTGITMPFMDWRTTPLGTTDRGVYQMRDVHEGATITEAELVVYTEKQVNIKKIARGLKQSYESIMFTPINLATVYFEELGVVMGADLDRSLINVLINGDQADNSQSAFVIGATTASTLTFTDIARAWIRFKRIFRTSTVMLTSEADAIMVMMMEQFLRKYYPGAQAVGFPSAPSGVTINVTTPLPNTQDIYVHDAIPTGKLVMVDITKAAVQLTAMPLLLETDKIIARQMNETFVSIITGFANIFRDGRLVLDYTTSLSTNPGPVVFS
jgi:hypothetical protein